MTFDLDRYLHLALKWWWLFIFSAVVPVVVSSYLLSQQPAIYQSRVVVMVGTTLQSPNPSRNDMTLAEQLARGYAMMVRYRPITSAVVQRLGLHRSPDQLAQQITTVVHPAANLLEIQVTDSDAQMATLIANLLADELIRQSPGSQTHNEQQQFVERQLTTLKARIEQVEAEIEEQEALLASLTSASEIRSAEDHLSSLETVLSRYRSEHSLYLQSYAGASANKLTIVEPATDPGYPLDNNKVWILMMAGLAGIGLAGGGVFLIESMDETIRWTSSEKDALFGLPILGVLGHMPVSAQAIMACLGERSPEADALRALRTTILFRRLRQPYQTLFATSPNSGEGKTLTVASLGVSIAAEGLRVVVVDADMRKPALHELFDLPNVSGLSDLLAHDAPEEDIVALKGLQPTWLPTLWVLSAGPIPLDPTVLLMSPRFSRLLKALCERADLVIFDCPPLVVKTDVSIVASQIRNVALVVADGLTTRGQVRQAIKFLSEQENISILGAILSDVRLGKQAYTYYKNRSALPRPLQSLWRGLMKRDTGMGKSGRDGLLTLSDAADRLGINTATARRWAKAGRLPVEKRGWLRLVRQEDVESMVAREATVQVGSSLSVQENGYGISEMQPSHTTDSLSDTDAER